MDRNDVQHPHKKGRSVLLERGGSVLAMCIDASVAHMDKNSRTLEQRYNAGTNFSNSPS